MDLTLADQYYLKAKGSYPWAIDDAIENLQYALSYDENHASANCLLGKVYMYQLKDYEKAAKCFYNALVGNINYPDTYKYFSLLRIWQGEYKRALIIIQKGLTIQGIDRSVLMLHLALIYELKGELEKAKMTLKQTKLFCIDPTREHQIKGNLSRLKKKIKAKNKRKGRQKNKVAKA